MPDFELTTTENGRLSNLLNLAQIQEETLNCITESYRNYTVGVVFKRLGLKPEDFSKAVINLNTGKLTIKEGEALPKKTMKADVKGGENGDRGTKPVAETKS
jgi:hypothetical protein